MKTPFLDILKKITGLSTPVFSVTWNPPKSEREIAQCLVTFLEDQRVLFSPPWAYHEDYAEKAVFVIRRRLTKDLEQIDRSSLLAKSIIAMRTACQKFHDAIQGEHWEEEIIVWPDNLRDQGRLRSSNRERTLASALGKLIGVFGMYVAQLCVGYEIDVGGQLVSILPATPDNAGK